MSQFDPSTQPHTVLSDADDTENGFTVLETLVAFFILSLLLGATAQLFVRGSQQLSRSAEIQNALFDPSLLETTKVRNGLDDLSRAGETKEVALGDWLVRIKHVGEAEHGSGNSVLAHISVWRKSSNDGAEQVRQKHFQTLRLHRASDR